jgi:two-component system response regulator YesN
LHITPNYLGRLFYEQTKVKVMDYLNEVRIAKASELMHDKTLSLSDISTMVGFRNQSYFSSCFLKVKKVSPREYRKRI